MCFKLRYRKRVIEFKGKRFTLDVADSPLKATIGLMGRENIPAYGGMLFIFRKESRHPFWMLGMKTAIDIIWLDRKGRVVYMSKDTPTCNLFTCRSIVPDKSALYVLELRAGTVKKLGIGNGSVFRT